MTAKWTSDELESSVIAYLDMRKKELDRIQFKKKDYYKSLAAKYGRSEKSYEYRMQNISYVFSAMGRRWVSGLKPKNHVGQNVLCELEDMIAKIEGNNISRLAQFMARISRIRGKNKKSKPSGNKNPKKLQTQTNQYQRDPEVIAWVLDEANDVCESCDKPAPFVKDDGSYFLEVHHLRTLADGGSDTITNAVAICPNCHRELHYGKHRLQKIEGIYKKVRRLVEE